jgi:hypothetical protein
MEVSGQIYAVTTLLPPPEKKNMGTQWIGDWEDLNVGVSSVEKENQIMIPWS